MGDHLPDDHCVDAFGIDLRRPLYPQVANLGDRYFDWVHTPIHRKTLRALAVADHGPWPGSVRIFGSDLLESMTHISWRLVLAIWVPVILALAAVARHGEGLAWGRIAGIWAAGFLVWTLVEYVLHRWFFHTPPRTPGQIRMHFLAHGIHHFDPHDATRLVFPPLSGAGIALVLYLVCELVMPTGAACALMSGLLSGYLVYDMSHYISHHARIRDPWFRYLARYHQAHHHREPEALFGVSSPLWDIVFRTGSSRS